jgi:hypothetical protein
MEEATRLRGIDQRFPGPAKPRPRVKRGKNIDLQFLPAFQARRKTPEVK